MKIRVKKHAKNACKVCGKTVNKKNGIQCQGDCKQWTHYLCLKFDPQKIKNIKAGKVKVVCPCPRRNEEIQANLSEPNHIFQNEAKPQVIIKAHKVINGPAISEHSKFKRQSIIARCSPACTTEREHIKNDKRYFDNVECLEKYAQKFQNNKPISNNDYVRQRCPHTVRAPQTRFNNDTFSHRHQPNACIPEKFQNPRNCAKQRTLERHPESRPIPERIPAASNIFIDNKTMTDRAEDLLCTPPVKKTQFEEPLPSNNEKPKPTCYCIAKSLQQKESCCRVPLTSSDSSVFERSPPKRTNQSMINALEGVRHTVGLLSNQIRELCKMMSNKQQCAATKCHKVSINC